MESAATLLATAWRELPPEDKFRRYMSVLGVPRHQNQDQIKQRLKREFPEEWKEFRAISERRVHGDMRDDVYALKNKNLRFSLLVTAFERVELHAKAFSLLERTSDPVTAILDVGCENGFLTCLLALRWPDARVIGMDPCIPAVDRARELASSLNLTNITFVLSAAADIPKNLRGETFDLITTITMLHDAKLLPSVAGLNRRNAELFGPVTIDALPPEFSAIASALRRPSARWVSMERCESPKAFAAWCQALDCAGLGIDYSESQRVPCEDDMLTMVVAGHERSRPIDYRKVQGVWITHDFNRWGVPGEPPWAFRDQQAEALFSQLSPKTCIDRVVASDGEAREAQRLEVWEAGPLCLLYHPMHFAGQTKLQIRSITDLQAMRHRWEEVMQELRQSAPSDIKFAEFHQAL